MSGDANDRALNDLIGREVVRIAADCYVLDDADLHDSREGHSSKELYVINAKKVGLRPNRRRTYILRHHVLTVSALDDVITD